MTTSLDAPAPEAAPPASTLTTPAGLQSTLTLACRRWIVLVLNAVTYGGMLWAAAVVLSAGEWTVVDAVLLVLFAIGTPWAVLGFWNALIGLWLRHGHKAPLAATAPFAAAGDLPSPIRIKTAILMTVRNEDPGRAILRLKTAKASLDATGEGAAYSYFVLSDTSLPEVAAAEEAAMAAWRASDPDSDRIVYRRRERNTGFKAGNVRDFCERWGSDFTLMLPLDADSLMAGPEIVRLTRMMQAHPKIGILQSLVVGMPSSSGFARIFQFGMRHGMRSYTMGQAWWAGDCGPYWGHNALVRIAPFLEQCQLPILAGSPPLGGHVLSHDQVEAALMRRAGYEVRVLPEEVGSWEENPPSMLAFAQRDVRWCQGNMQYLKLLDLPGLLPTSRLQLAWAVMMFMGIPAWTLMIGLLPVAVWQTQGAADFPAGLAIGVYVTFFLMYLMPKIAGLIDAMLTRDGVARYGGRVRFLAGAATELVFSFLQGAVSTLRTTVFMLGLAFGRSVTWGGQARDAERLSWRAAALALWPQTLFGFVVCGALLAISPSVLWWSLPLTAGYLLAVPFAVVTAHPAFGKLLQRAGLCGVPEDFAMPTEVHAVMGEPR
ncbi:MAG TPA: glucans biosynthesis glucosyltransferase MdoH [Hyphomicrobiaceae bacterium]|nr:glucans biosynthesis glucosyltransferase MdoH [Hyphomicrobiaceae bacterium]